MVGDQLPELIRPHALAATAEALRSDRLNPVNYVENMCARIARTDPVLKAMRAHIFST